VWLQPYVTHKRQLFLVKELVPRPEEVDRVLRLAGLPSSLGKPARYGSGSAPASKPPATQAMAQLCKRGAAGDVTMMAALAASTKPAPNRSATIQIFILPP
jgi:hypothetical protein